MRLKRGRAYVAATMVATVGVVVGLQGPASAAVGIVHVNGGFGRFLPDPVDTLPGDSIDACDMASDGWGIESRLDIGNNGSWDRVVDTRGHTAPYCTGFVGGNIREGTVVRLRVTPVKGTQSGQWTEGLFIA
ncbi:hypothetical protein ABZ807_31765 [Micromonospora sp. NPDC047548]|uniref:hypothetical protein n=1 Tax=Micromonospora sp. NPDC047548 TaxID=3155624 RepID=UPI0033DE398B